MKICILTFYPSTNCGAMLQAWALQQVLTQMGHKVSFPVCKDLRIPRRFDLVFTRSTFIGKMRNLVGWLINEVYNFPITDLKFYRMTHFSTKFFCTQSYKINQIESDNDLIVVGSDQVWNENLAKSRLVFFLGEVFKGEIPLVGYALSWGDTSPSPEHLIRLKQAAQRFSYLTVREPYALPLLQSLTDKPVYQVVDPTLLLKAEDYELLVSQKRLEKRPYIVAYIVRRNKTILQKVQQIAEAIDLKLVLIDVYRSPREKCEIKNTWAVSPDRFLNYIKYAECVIAASYHGCVFATLFKKPFIFLTDEPDKRNMRPIVLLEMLQQSFRVCSPKTSIEQILESLCTLLPSKVDGILEKLSLESRIHLSKMIKNRL